MKQRSVTRLKPEQQTQVAICEWARLKYPALNNHIIAILNDGKRSVAGHVTAKRMGLLKGASDLFFSYPNKRYHGLYLEVKSDNWNGPRSKAEREHIQRQLAFIENQRKIGYWGEMVIGIDHAMTVISKYMKDV